MHNAGIVPDTLCREYLTPYGHPVNFIIAQSIVVDERALIVSKAFDAIDPPGRTTWVGDMFVVECIGIDTDCRNLGIRIEIFVMTNGIPH